jgi:hypothetical protein
MAQFTNDQKTWVDKFLQQPDGNGATDLKPGNVQAIGAGQVLGPAVKVAKKVWDWISEQGETTIIIENRSSKILRRKDGDGFELLEHKKDATWKKKAPPSIAPKDKATLVIKTDKAWRGKATAITAGSVAFEIDGEAKPIVRIGWYRKGAGQLDKKFTFAESGKFSVDGYQSNDGEFTFWFEDAATP